MSRVEMEWGLDALDEPTHVNAVTRGAECGLRCMECKMPLVAKQGKILAWHLAHAADSACGGYKPETLLHRRAKHLLATRPWRELNHLLSTSPKGVREEVRYPDSKYRADAGDGVDNFAEVVVHHDLDGDKRDYLRDTPHNVFTYRLSPDAALLPDNELAALMYRSVQQLAPTPEGVARYQLFKLMPGYRDAAFRYLHPVFRYHDDDDYFRPDEFADSLRTLEMLAGVKGGMPRHVLNQVVLSRYQRTPPDAYALYDFWLDEFDGFDEIVGDIVRVTRDQPQRYPQHVLRTREIKYHDQHGIMDALYCNGTHPDASPEASILASLVVHVPARVDAYITAAFGSELLYPLPPVEDAPATPSRPFFNYMVAQVLRSHRV